MSDPPGLDPGGVQGADDVVNLGTWYRSEQAAGGLRVDGECDRRFPNRYASGRDAIGSEFPNMLAVNGIVYVVAALIGAFSRFRWPRSASGHFGGIQEGPHQRHNQVSALDVR